MGPDPRFLVSPHTLSHKILEVMPFDVVGQIADVDAAVLLRSFPNVVHDLFTMSGAVLESSMGGLSVVTSSLSSSRRTLASHGGAASSPMATPRTITGRV